VAGVTIDLDAIIEENAQVRAELIAAIDALPADRRLEPGLLGEWSLNDVLAHIAGWQEAMASLSARWSLETLWANSMSMARMQTSCVRTRTRRGMRCWRGCAVPARRTTRLLARLLNGSRPSNSRPAPSSTSCFE
jgi:hypothetical protein